MNLFKLELYEVKLKDFLFSACFTISLFIVVLLFFSSLIGYLITEDKISLYFLVFSGGIIGLVMALGLLAILVTISCFCINLN